MVDLLSIRNEIRRLLTSAQNCEESGCPFQACDLYEEIITEISDLLLEETSTIHLRTHQRNLDRAYSRVQEFRHQFNYHNLHGTVEKDYEIAENTTNMNYDKIFNRYLNSSVKEILVYAPQCRRRSHLKNFMHFLELVVRRCPNITYVRLVTVCGARHKPDHVRHLKQIQACLTERKIKFNYRFLSELKDNMVILNTGYIIQIEHGLNYFQETPTQFVLGICDYDFRKCLRTQVLVWRTTPYIQPISVHTRR